ncbi:MAG: DNA topoisomerase IV subunit A [Candidatus Aenigmarchaeota archaeon]|jgi:DNA topoisomerase-6 subunit A|nr:DNA topoisomerase IV subunit A [Candidatus Aenigmarchaeota archaeon]
MHFYLKPKKKEEILLTLKALGDSFLKEIEEGKNPSVEIPTRTLRNVRFDEKNRRLYLGGYVSRRYLLHLAQIRSFTQLAGVAALAKKLIEEDKHVSLRETFYILKRTIPGLKRNIVDEQEESNRAVEDLELVINALREQLHINANKLGAVAGNVVIRDRGDLIDWSKLGSGGWSVPSNVEDIEFVKVDAKFVLYIEKSAVWERLHEDKVWKKLNCIIVASQGQATRGIRRLLQRLNYEHGLPIFVLTDADPWGIYIYSVIKFGSITLAHVSDRLAVPSAKFLGLKPSDVKKYGLEKHLIKLKEIDKKRLNEVRNYEWFKKNKEWQREFDLMAKMDAKAELEALAARGITFISDKYLPEKLKNEDWLD